MQGIKFLGKVGLFLVPLILFLGFPVWALYRSGDLMSDDAMVAREAATSTPVVIGLAYSNPTAYLQLQSTILRKSDVLVLGASRVEEIRSGFFDPGVNMYNAGGVVQKISYFRHFLDKIPADQSPKLLVIGLDQKFFDPNYDSLAPDTIDTLLTQPMSTTDVLTNWSLVYRDYFEKKFSLSDLLHPASSAIGMAAVVKGSGFRNDGSYDPGPAIYIPAGEDPTFSDIDKGIVGFEYSNTISPGAVQELDAFLEDCHERNIKVIGFIPPFAPDVYAKLMSMPNDYGYINQLSPSIAPIFQKYGDAFYNFTDPASLGLTNKEMIDGIHMTERGALIAFIKIASSNTTLQEYSNVPFLKQTLASTTAEIDLFGSR